MNEKQKKEALRLIRQFALPEAVQTAFGAEQALYVSEIGENRRTFTATPATPAERTMADRFAAKTGNAPYHLLRSMTETGVIYTVLFVRPCQWPWQKFEEPTALPGGQGYALSAYQYYAGPVLERTQPLESERGGIETVKIQTIGEGIACVG